MKKFSGRQGAQQIIDIMRERADGDMREISRTVEGILADVKQRGDEALAEYTYKLDNTDYHTAPLRVPESEIDAAYAQCPDELLQALRRSIANCRRYHEKQMESGYELDDETGYLAQIVRPLQAVGIYAPGGTAAYPSSVVMNVVPAKIAGVERICMATPAHGGKLPPLTLVAARESGVDEVYRMGGAQAIAAFAYGTQTVPRVNKITGPGNAYVAEAKRQLFGKVGIDSVAGPSEVLVIADETANPAYLAADLLSQAEHDTRAAAIFVTTDDALADKVVAEVERQLALLPRETIAAQSVQSYGAALVLDTLDECVAFSNEIAPEHLEIVTRDPRAQLEQVRNAGGIFLGAYSPEPLGDYMAGTNHVLPTDGTAKFSSALGVYDFLKRSSVVQFNKQQLEAMASDIEIFAKTEGLDAHARSISVRFGGEK